MNEPPLLAVAVAICVKPPVNGKSCFSRATGVDPAPDTEPCTVSPEPQIGRIVDGVMATAVGAREVVNVRLPERVMPAALVATVRKLYRVFGRRPVSAALTATAEPPAPIACSGVAEPYDVDVPYSKRTVVASERAFTLAAIVAPVALIPVVERLEIEGAAAGAVVRSVRSTPALSPDAFVATTR